MEKKVKNFYAYLINNKDLRCLSYSLNFNGFRFGRVLLFIDQSIIISADLIQNNVLCTCKFRPVYIKLYKKIEATYKKRSKNKNHLIYGKIGLVKKSISPL